MSQKKSKSIEQVKNITIRFNPEQYEKLLAAANGENRSLANFIETAMLENLEEKNFVDDFEMQEILSNKDLLKGLEQSHKDAKAKKGRFV